MATVDGDEGLLQGTAHAVAVQVLRHGPIPRSRVARRLGLSNGSLTRLSKPLLDSGLLVETPPVTDPDSRRPTRPLDVATRRHRFVGINLSGTGAWAVLTDLRTAVLAEASVELTSTSPEHVVRSVCALVEQVVQEDPGEVAGLGLSLGGFVDRDGVVHGAAFLDWSGPVPLGALVARACGLPVVVGNDLAALTRSEHWFGEGRHHTSFAVVTVGAGVGYGLVLNDQVVETDDTGRQMLGHHPLAAGGLRCSEGHRGCATATLTIPAITATASFASRRGVDFDEVLALAAAGDRAARRVLDDAAGHLGVLLATVANITSVNRIVLAGEGAGYAQVAEASLARSLQEHRDPAASPVALVHRPHDFSAWARGAAGMAVHAFASGSRWLG